MIKLFTSRGHVAILTISTFVSDCLALKTILTFYLLYCWFYLSEAPVLLFIKYQCSIFF